MSRAFPLFPACLLLACASPQRPPPAQTLDHCAAHLIQSGCSDAAELERAEVACNLALEYAPYAADVHNNLALISICRGQWEEARKSLARALHANPDHASAHNNLALCYLHQEEWGHARDEFAAALRVDPRYTDARLGLGDTLRRLGDPAAARKAYLTVEETDPGNAQAPHTLCAMDLEAGQHDAALLDRAREECQRALRIDPQRTGAYVTYAAVLLLQGQACEAREAYAECLRLDPKRLECRDFIQTAAQRCAQTPADVR